MMVDDDRGRGERVGGVQKLRWPNLALFWPSAYLLLTCVDIWQNAYLMSTLTFNTLPPLPLQEVHHLSEQNFFETCNLARDKNILYVWKLKCTEKSFIWGSFKKKSTDLTLIGQHWHIKNYVPTYCWHSLKFCDILYSPD